MSTYTKQQQVPTIQWKKFLKKSTEMMKKFL